MNLKGTQTEKNIQAAFAGESQARSKYTYFSEIAAKEGNAHLTEHFEKMAENEKQHAKLWFKLMDLSGDSIKNLMTAIAGENYEWTEMYKGFASTARAEGLEEVATLFDRVSDIERDHERRFLVELAKLASEQSNAVPPVAVPEAARAFTWRCPICGYGHVGPTEPPYACPLCGALGTFVREG